MSLGHPHQQTPPVIEMLLTDPTALLAGGVDTIPMTPLADDALGRLERDLRHRGAPVDEESLALDRRPGAPLVAAADSTPLSDAARIEAVVVADLEAWLAVLASERPGSSPS
jgi:hypothetical protein